MFQKKNISKQLLRALSLLLVLAFAVPSQVFIAGAADVSSSEVMEEVTTSSSENDVTSQSVPSEEATSEEISFAESTFSEMEDEETVSSEEVTSSTAVARFYGIQTTTLQEPTTEEAVLSTCTITYAVDGSVFHTETIFNNTLASLPSSADVDPDGTRHFIGWYDENGTRFAPHTLVTSDLILTAKFSEHYIAVFYDVNGTELDAIEFSGGDCVTKTTKTPALAIDEECTHWYLEGTQTPFDFTVPMGQDLALYPHVTKRAVAVFVTQGSYIPTQTVAVGATVSKPSAEPTRPGYTFARWAVDAENSAVFDFENTTVTGTVFIYAAWTPIKVPYLVNYWVEKPNLTDVGDASDPANISDYELVYTKEMNAANNSDVPAGSLVSFNETTANAMYGTANASAVDLLNFSTFHYSEEKVISGTGTTVINVYYQRTVFTMHFHYDTAYSNNVRTPAGAAITGTVTLKNGNGDIETDGIYTISFKYGQDLSDIWPSSVDTSASTNMATKVFANWSGYYGNNAFEASFSYISVGYVSAYTGQYTPMIHGRPIRTEAHLYPILTDKSFSELRYYYTEVSEQEVRDAGLTPSALPTNGATFTDDDMYVRWTSSNAAYGGTRYYKLTRIGGLNYQLSNPGTSAKEWPGTSINGYEAIYGATSREPCTTKDFQQVFLDNGNTNPAVVAGAHYRIYYFMPAKTYKLTLVLNGGAIATLPNGYNNSNLASPFATLRINEAITVPTNADAENVTKEHYAFAGWYLDENFNVPFESGTMPANDLTLYAKFVGTSVSVTYYDNGNLVHTQTYAKFDYLSDHAFANNSIYCSLQKGDYVPGKGYFQGWYYQAISQDAASTVEFPLDISLQEAAYTLTALWTPVTYQVTYADFDGIAFDSKTVSSTSNTVALCGQRSPVPFVAGYAFKGWFTAPNGQGTRFTDASSVTENVTLYPYYIKLVTVQFDSNGGKLAFQNTAIILEEGESLASAGKALDSYIGTRNGCKFLGWSLSSTGKVDATLSMLALSSDVTLYAVWEALPIGESPSSSESEGYIPAPVVEEPTAAKSPSTALSTTSVAPSVSETPIDELDGRLIPLGSLSSSTTWSLLNLILSAMAFAFSVLLLISLLRKKEDKKEQNEATFADEAEPKKNNRNRILKALSILFGLVTGLLFLLLEDFTLPISFINSWTPMIATAFALHFLCLLVPLFTPRKEEKNEQPTLINAHKI